MGIAAGAERVLVHGRHIAGASPRKRASRSASNMSSEAADEVGTDQRADVRRSPQTSGTWETAAFTRVSIAATTSTCPPE